MSSRMETSPLRREESSPGENVSSRIEGFLPKGTASWTAGLLLEGTVIARRDRLVSEGTSSPRGKNHLPDGTSPLGENASARREGFLSKGTASWTGGLLLEGTV